MAFRQIINGNTLGKNFPLPEDISTNEDVLSSLIFGTSRSQSAYSLDGETWNTINAPELKLPSSASYGWKSSVYGKNKFIVFGSNEDPFSEDPSPAAYSEDLINWTMIGGLSSFYSASAYGNGKFVFADDSLGFLYSEDGITWTQGTNLGAMWISATYADGVFVAVQSSRKAAYSTDGISWTQVNMPPDQYANYSSVTYGEGKFVAIAGSNYYINSCYSVNGGQTWTLTTVPYAAWAEIGYGNGRFVALSYPYAGGASAIFSEDGITWTIGANSAEYFYPNSKIIYSNNKFFAFGAQGEVVSSENGKTWTLIDENISLSTGVRGYAKIGETIKDRLNAITRSI